MFYNIYISALASAHATKKKETPLKTIETQNSNSLATAYIEYKYEKIAKNGHFGVLDGPLLITRLS